MKAPKQFTNQTLKGFTKEIMDRIGGIEGIGIQAAGGTFGDMEFTMKIKFTLKDTDFKTHNQKAYEFQRKFNGLPEWGFKFKDWSGEVHEMVDYRPRATKFPIIGENKAGTQYKFSVDQVKNNIVEEE